MQTNTSCTLYNRYEKNNGVYYQKTVLKAVFWDMTEITSKVETIDHPGGEDSEGWTESILHITITPKTADEMRAVYAFTD